MRSTGRQQAQACCRPVRHFQAAAAAQLRKAGQDGIVQLQFIAKAIKMNVYEPK